MLCAYMSVYRTIDPLVAICDLVHAVKDMYGLP